MAGKEIFIAAIVLACSLALNAQDLSKPPAQRVPAFTFFRFDNSTFSDKDLSTGRMLFFIFMDPDCDHCQLAMQRIGEQYDAFKNAAIYIVSEYAPERIGKFMSTYGAGLKGRKNVTLLYDRQQQFIARFNPRRYPSMLLYSSAGKLIEYEDDPNAVIKLAVAARAASR